MNVLLIAVIFLFSDASMAWEVDRDADHFTGQSTVMLGVQSSIFDDVLFGGRATPALLLGCSDRKGFFAAIHWGQPVAAQATTIMVHTNVDDGKTARYEWYAWGNATVFPDGASFIDELKNYDQLSAWVDPPVWVPYIAQFDVSGLKDQFHHFKEICRALPSQTALEPYIFSRSGRSF